MGAVIFAWVYSISFSPQPVASTVPPAIPTVTPIPDDRLALPSPTAIPTATPAPPTATTAPTVAAVAAPPTTAPTQPTAPQAVDVAVQAQPTPAPVEQAQPAAGTVMIRVIAQGDIQLTVVADGAVVYSGWMGSGQATDWFNGSSFEVTTTDGSLTLFENAATGQQFYMGYGPNETYYLGA
jgi:hypothetical protein